MSGGLILPADLIVPGTAYAYVSWGRWVVECGAPFCSGALTLGPDVTLPDGQIKRGLAWGADSMQCWDCDFISKKVRWPNDPLAIEMLLMARPDPRTRNWFPNETLQDLFAENAIHGLLPKALNFHGPSVGLMATLDERIVGGLLLDALPDADKRRELTSGEN